MKTLKYLFIIFCLFGAAVHALAVLQPEMTISWYLFFGTGALFYLGIAIYQYSKLKKTIS